jgi:hypothetical protein
MVREKNRNSLVNNMFFLLVFFFLVLSVTITQSLTPIQNQQSDNIHLKPPHLSGDYRDNRPPFSSSKNLNEVYPCNGTYLKTNGTTCGLKEIMIGRCYEYQYIKRGLYLSNTT